MDNENDYSAYDATLPLNSTINMSSVYIPSTTTPYGNITISTAAGANGTSFGSNYYNYYNTSNTSSGNLQVTGNAQISGDLTVQGINIAEAIEKINKRLAILVPDPGKLEKFEALKRAYENYKTLEALCELPKEDE